MNKIDMINDVQFITGEVVGKIFFGENFSEHRYEGLPLTKALTNLLIEMIEVTINPMTLLVGPRVAKMGVLPSHRRLLRKN